MIFLRKIKKILVPSACDKSLKKNICQKISGWHALLDLFFFNLFLQDIFDEWYIGSSGREKGRLFHLKNYFNHRNVTRYVKESFNYWEEFIGFCTEGLHCMTTVLLNDISFDFRNNKQEQIRYMKRMATEVMDEIFISSQDIVEKYWVLK